jgi:putative endonuclease
MKKGDPAHLETGKWGERVAARYLKREVGYRIIGCRVRVGDRDELDIIARDGKTLVFVEVKTRSTIRFGRPNDAVDRHKRHTLSRGAVRYIGRLRNPRIYFRFDVVEVTGHPDDPDPTINHIENAFPLDPRYSLPS